MINEPDYVGDDYINECITSRDPKRFNILLCGTPGGVEPAGTFERSFISSIRDMDVYNKYSTHWYDYREGIVSGLLKASTVEHILNGITIERFLTDYYAMFPQEVKRALHELNKADVLKYFNRTYMRPWQRFKRWIREKIQRW